MTFEDQQKVNVLTVPLLASLITLVSHRFFCVSWQRHCVAMRGLAGGCYWAH